MCEAIVNKYQGQLYKGFKDLDSVPFISYACTSVLIYDDLGNIKHAKDFGHSCTNNCTTGKSNESEDENVNSECYQSEPNLYNCHIESYLEYLDDHKSCKISQQVPLFVQLF
jgi:hypothetical protein